MSRHKQASGMAGPRYYMAAAEIFLSPFLGSVSCFDFILKQAPLTAWRAGLQLQVSILPFRDPNGRGGSLPGHCNKMLELDTHCSGLGHMPIPGSIAMAKGLEHYDRLRLSHIPPLESWTKWD